MEPLKQFFFDTYALVEIALGNERYLPYATEVGMIVTKFNLMEFHYSLLRTCGKEAADIQYDQLLPFVIEVSDEVIKRANELKLVFKERKLSYVDCIGYVMAKLIGIKFLTGDIQFKDMENIEYVH